MLFHRSPTQSNVVNTTLQDRTPACEQSNRSKAVAKSVPTAIYVNHSVLSDLNNLVKRNHRDECFTMNKTGNSRLFLNQGDQFLLGLSVH
jgi:hypothetical protein